MREYAILLSMTLLTQVYIIDQIDPEQAFNQARETIGATSQHYYSKIEQDTKYSWVKSGDMRLSNLPGSGLNALLSVNYNQYGMVFSDQDQAKMIEDEHPEIDQIVPAHWVQVSFDTAYGYQGEKYGEGCNALHSKYVIEFGRWLDQQYLSWAWKDEFNGKVHSGPTRYLEAINFAVGSGTSEEYIEKELKPALQRTQTFSRTPLNELFS
jgi:hypothetical protein